MTDNLLNAEVPDKFKNPDTGEVKWDMLAQSYRELEKRLSQTPSAPKSPEDYCIECQHGMFTSDPDINRRLHQKGFTNDQAQEVYNLAAERMMPMMMELAADFQADREVEKLVNHFGGPDHWKEVSRQLLAFGQKNLPADVLEGLSSSYEGVLALHRMMKAGEPALQRSSGTRNQIVTDEDLASMMRDPKYWRDKDPAFVAKVTEGFKTLYGGK